MIVWDTSVVIDVLRGNGEAVRYASSFTGVPLCSEITRVEVLRGVRSAERERTDRLLQRLRWVALDEAIARHAGDLGRRWRKSHPGLGSADLLIAATVEEVGGKLATMNVRHFPMFRGLRPPYA